MTDGGETVRADVESVAQNTSSPDDAPPTPEHAEAPTQPPASVWLRVKRFFAASVPVVLGAAFVPLAWMSSRDKPEKVVVVIGWIALLVIAIVGRRPRLGPRALAVAPALVLWTGVVGMAVQVASWGESMGYMVEPADQQRAYYDELGDSLAISGLAALYGSLLLAQGAAFLFARARAMTSPLRWNGVIAVAFVVVSFPFMLLMRSFLGVGRAEGIFTSALASVALAMVLIGVRVIRRAEPKGESAERVWETTLAAGLFALGSVVAATGLDLSEVCSRLLGVMGSDNFSISDRARTHASMAVEIARALNLGLVGMALVVLVLLIGLGVRIDAARGRALSIAAVALALFAIPIGALVVQASSLVEQGIEYRLGEPGQIVLDRRLGPGMLQVELVPLASWGSYDVTTPAHVIVTPGSKALWKPGMPVMFTHLSRNKPLRVEVDGDYLVSPVPTFVMPRDVGVRLRVGVLNLLRSPLPVATNVEPEKILHLVIAPESYTSRWASGRVLHAESKIVKSKPDLAKEIQKQWKEYGNHQSDRDPKLDTAIIYFGPDEPLTELVSVGGAVSYAQREMTYRSRFVERPVFRIWFAPLQRPVQNLAVELDADRWSDEVRAVPSVVMARVTEGLARCEGDPCADRDPRDPWKRDRPSRCDVYLCSADTVAKLWRELAVARAATGAVTGAQQAFFRARVLQPTLAPPKNLPAAGEGAFQRASEAKLPRLRQGAWTVEGGLSPRVLQATVARQQGLLRACYADGLAANRSLRGRVSMRIVVGRDGFAMDVTDGGSDLPSPEVIACFARHLRGVQFPAPEGGVSSLIATWILSPP